MSTVLIRGSQRLGYVVNLRTKVPKITRKCMSTTLLTNKITDGPNGEKIIASPFPEVSTPSLTVPEYVWENVNKYGHLTALECGLTGRKYTYSEARDASNYVARSLLSLGLKKGDTVALILPNIPEYPIVFLGALEAGLVVTTVNPVYVVEEITRQFINSDTKIAITTAEIAPVVVEAVKASLLPTTPIIVIKDETQSIPANMISYEDFVAKGKSLPPIPSNLSNPDDLAVLPYSSGTTGLPKGVMLTHKNLTVNMEQLKSSVSEIAWKETTDTFQDIIPTILPMFHIYGMNAIMLPRLSTGSKLITIPKFTPEVYIKVLEKFKPTLLFCVPPIILFLSSSQLVKKEYLERIRCIFSGAAPIGKSDVDRLLERFKLDMRFIQGYGMTESSPLIFIQTSDVIYNTIGQPVSSTEARLIDISTKKDITTPGKTGEIWVRGPQIMKGYHKNEEATKQTIMPGEWLATGDGAYFDENLEFYLTDRLKELIKVKGYQVAPAELEEVLRTHPDVQEAAVIGVPDKRDGEVPKAFITLKKGKKTSKEDIQNYIKGKVAEYKALRGGVEFLDEIPKNPSGKILRARLKETNSK